MKAQSPRRITCPRCSAPVTGDFKFCPSCAFRLHPGEAPEETPPAVGSRLGPALLVTGALIVVAGFLAFGLMLFGPDAKPRPEERRPQRLDHPLTVHDILEEMASLQAGVAYYLSAPPEPRAKLAAAMGFMRYEVTRGQWAEFVRDCEKHPEKIPLTIREKVWQNPAYVDAYVDAWWELAKDHLGTARPAYLDTPVLTDAAGLLLLVPPSWTRLTEWDEITWDLPREGTALIPENLPVTEVSWWCAIAFAEWATAELKVATRLRLPLESEWIRAAHGNEPQRRWPWGSEPFPYASNTLNFWSRSGSGQPLPVDFVYGDAPGVTREGVWGMAGNATEWTYFDQAAEGEDDVDTARLAPRYGGSFQQGLDDCTVESFVSSDKRERFPDSGFRLMLEKP